jgi:hypothetical protein
MEPLIKRNNKKYSFDCSTHKATVEELFNVKKQKNFSQRHSVYYLSSYQQQTQPLKHQKKAIKSSAVTTPSQHQALDILRQFSDEKHHQHIRRSHLLIL